MLITVNASYAQTFLISRSLESMLDEVVYTILGAWDSVPEENIVAYSSKLGAKLIGHSVGDKLRLPLEMGGTPVMMTIKSITPAPKELIFPDEEYLPACPFASVMVLTFVFLISRLNTGKFMLEVL